MFSNSKVCVNYFKTFEEFGSAKYSPIAYLDKPFVFNKLGVEICNGLMIKDDLVYFSWGEDDLEMYVGRCSKAELMDWFNENLQN